MWERTGNWFPRMWSLDTWGVAASWFAGIATLLVVFLALGLQMWYERAKRPKLRVLYEKSNAEDNRYVALNSAQEPLSSGEEQATEELWLRMNIVNDSKITANDVELRFIYIYSIKEGSNAKDDRPSWWFKVANLNAFSIPVPPRFKQPFDIAYVKNCNGEDADLRFFLAIVPPDLKDWAAEKQRIEIARYNRLEVGIQYRLVFAVVSSNANATYYEFKINVCNRTEHDLDRKHLQGPDSLRRRFEVIGPTVIKNP